MSPVIQTLRAWRILHRTLAATLAATATGCVPYPVHKTMQPAARVTVMDTQSQPLSDARVILISRSYPYGRERSRQEVRTMPTGKASFSAQTEWRVESLMLHGSEIYFWNWCVEKAGYETYETLNNAASQFDDKLIVQLPPGKSRSCDRL